jgi:hypothetical protein
VHVVGLLDASKDEVANIEGSFPNVAIMIASLSHDSNESSFFEAVEVHATCLFGFSFHVELNLWGSESDIGRKYGF